jgi:hypothetical protein
MDKEKKGTKRNGIISFIDKAGTKVKYKNRVYHLQKGIFIKSNP